MALVKTGNVFATTTLSSDAILLGAGTENLKESALTISGGVIQGVSNPSAGTDALNLQTGDANYAPLNTTQQGIKKIDLSAATTTPIVDGIIAPYFNIVYEQATQQFAIDSTLSTGTNISVSLTRYTQINNGGPVINTAWGIFSVAVAPAATLKYFPANPDTSVDPNPALGADYRFTSSTSQGGEIWRFACSITDGVTVTQSFFITATKLNEFNGSINVPTLTVDYQYFEVL